MFIATNKQFKGCLVISFVSSKDTGFEDKNFLVKVCR